MLYKPIPLGLHRCFLETNDFLLFLQPKVKKRVLRSLCIIITDTWYLATRLAVCGTVPAIAYRVQMGRGAGIGVCKEACSPGRYRRHQAMPSFFFSFSVSLAPQKLPHSNSKSLVSLFFC